LPLEKFEKHGRREQPLQLYLQNKIMQLSAMIKD